MTAAACSKCGDADAGPGGVLCPPCLEALTERARCGEWRDVPERAAALCANSPAAVAGNQPQRALAAWQHADD